jgi:hypothetical protein
MKGLLFAAKKSVISFGSLVTRETSWKTRPLQTPTISAAWALALRS